MCRNIITLLIYHMSGLLPRTTGENQSGSFKDLTVQTLTVSLVGYVNSLVVGSLSIASLILNSLTTPLINGSPNLNIVAGTTSVNGDTVTTNTASQSLSNKTINSANNTLTITNPPLAAVNVNSLINQDIRTTASPTFDTCFTTTRFWCNTTSATGLVINQTSPTANNEASFWKNGSFRLSVGSNNLTDENYIWSYNVNPLKIGTNATERLRILSTGIGNDNTTTSILGLQGTTLVFKNNVVDTNTAQTLTNKTLTTPVISTITNTGTLTLPTITGTLALVSQIPTNTTYVDLTSAQSITGVKTFSTAPVISTITNTGTLTLPTTTTTLVGTNTTNTLTTKTIDSASNTLTITNSPLSAVNVNSLINQDVRTTASPSFISPTVVNLNANFVGTTATATPGLIASTQYLGNTSLSTYSVSRTVAAGASGVILLQYPTVTNSSINMDGEFTAFATTAPGGGGYRHANVFYNSAGVVTNAGVLFNDKKEAGGAGFAGKLVVTFSILGTNAIMQVANSAAYAINIAGTINVFQSL